MLDPTVEVFTWNFPDKFRIKYPEKGNCMALKVLENGFKRYVENFNSREIALSIGDVSLIGSVNEQREENSPMCSPFTLFCLYPKTKIRSINNPWIRYFLLSATSLLSFPFKLANIDRVIQLNNKPCDAIIYPKLSIEALKESLGKLKKAFPRHAIIFPRIDRMTSPDLIKDLESLGFLLIPTRMVHIFHPSFPYLCQGHTKRDKNLLEKSHYRRISHEEINPSDLPRIHQLYTMLFVEKHGKESPKLTLDYIVNCHREKWYTFFALRNPEGAIDAFFSYETKDQIMATGPLGYDTSLPQKLGLYRILFSESLKIANDGGFIFNFGGGNEEFKVRRGSKREIGYTAVYCEGLPFYQTLPWKLLEKLGRKVTVKILRKVKFA